MNIEEYISSGTLELYVFGLLSESENEEISEILKKYPEIEKEVTEIENSLLKLSGGMAPYDPKELYNQIKTKLNLTDNETPVIEIPKKNNQWISYVGWAASIALLFGILSLYNTNKQLKDSIVDAENTIEDAKTENILLEEKITLVEHQATKTEELLNVLRNKDILEIPLAAQKVDPNAYAAVYWDKTKQTTYIDVAGLPTPPKGKVYQVWSLKLDPLTPTSLGILDKFTTDDTKIFALSNVNDSQAFGITLEPEGGSESPNLEQLYTLGVVDQES